MENHAYSEFNSYGYRRYYIVGKKAVKYELSKNEICKAIIDENFSRAIVIKNNKENNIVKTVYECTQ